MSKTGMRFYRAQVEILEFHAPTINTLLTRGLPLNTLDLVRTSTPMCVTLRRK
jgi:hypothetical protein